MEVSIPESHKYTVDEFEALPENERYELIDGELYPLYAMGEPLRVHMELVMRLSSEIFNYIDSKKGDCRVYPAPFGVRLSEEEDTVLEPDITVVCDRDKLTDKGCSGAPDWVIEVVSPGNPAHDYLDKLKLYTEGGVREYWIVNPAKKSVTVYNSDDPYLPRSFTFEDTVKAGIYDDLYIDFRALDEKIW